MVFYYNSLNKRRYRVKSLNLNPNTKEATEEYYVEKIILSSHCLSHLWVVGSIIHTTSIDFKRLSNIVIPKRGRWLPKGQCR